MAKKFYTERDIEDMVARGQDTLNLSEDVVLTALAYEKAERMGLKLVQVHERPPSSPIRPYLSEAAQAASDGKPCAPPASTQNEALRQRIHRAVEANLGDRVDPELLDTIITRVLNNVRMG